MKERIQKKGVVQRHDPLHIQHQRDTTVEIDSERKRSRAKRRSAKDPVKITKQKDVSDDDDEPKSEFLDAKSSKKILELVREQQDEVERELQSNDSISPKRNPTRLGALDQQIMMSKDSDEDVSDEEMEDEEYEDIDFGDELGIDASDAALVDKYLNNEPRKQLNLADLIMSKIHENEQSTPKLDDEMDESAELDAKVVDAYTKVGLFLSRYKSGPLPKTFKILPSFPNWQEILEITQPSEWTPHAVYQATRIFASNLKDHMAQKFYNMVLLEHVRNDIAETKKLNYHLYMALKKALYKPKAFFKGILIPLCEDGSCTLREAAIIGSVLTKVSIPSEHSAAALLKLAELDYSGPNSLFIRILLDKKYALPFKAVDSLVFHFLRFTNPQVTPELPVLWHQSLLVFAQRYKDVVTDEQKEALMHLIKVRSHHTISAEIRRELSEAKSKRDESVKVDVMEFSL
ncbi:hypothetical protein HK098_008252 [Nowakowskiella sp. JEL0407]|nr:hypothetical protein HK098_008252 [Nowakowskiella sp. JEL0407]